MKILLVVIFACFLSYSESKPGLLMSPQGDLIFAHDVQDGTWQGKPAYVFKYDSHLGTDCGNDDGWAYKADWKKVETDRPCSISGNTWKIIRLEKIKK